MTNRLQASGSWDDEWGQWWENQYDMLKLISQSVFLIVLNMKIQEFRGCYQPASTLTLRTTTKPSPVSPFFSPVCLLTRQWVTQIHHCQLKRSKCLWEQKGLVSSKQDWGLILTPSPHKDYMLRWREHVTGEMESSERRRDAEEVELTTTRVLFAEALITEPFAIWPHVFLKHPV